MQNHLYQDTEGPDNPFINAIKLNAFVYKDNMYIMTALYYCALLGLDRVN